MRKITNKSKDCESRLPLQYSKVSACNPPGYWITGAFYI